MVKKQSSTSIRLKNSPLAKLPSTVSFYLLVSILVSFLASAMALTPLYAIYETEWGLSTVDITVVFGVYAISLLASLLFFGSLSDYVGRRPVLLVTVFIQAAIMLIFATASDLPGLLLARVLQGLATGSAIGALGAALLDLNKENGTVANGVGTPFGTAIGALGSSLIAQFLHSTRLVFVLLFVIFIIQGLGLMFIAESSTKKSGAFASMIPKIGIPKSVRQQLLVALPALVAGWALAGFYGSIGPTLVRLVANSHSFVLGGLAFFAIGLPGSIVVLTTRTRSPRTVLLLGTVCLVIGVGITLVSTVYSSVIVFLIGTVISGLGFGGSFQGALRTLLPQSAPHERANMLSSIYIICYLSFSIPTIIAGFLVEHEGLLTTAREYGYVIMVLSALALVGLLRRPIHSSRGA